MLGQLDSIEIELLDNLIANPTLSMRKLSEKLETYPQNVKKWIERLTELNVLPPKSEQFDKTLGKINQGYVGVRYNPNALGFERHHIFISSINSSPFLQKLKRVMILHPFVHGISDVISETVGLYTVFDVPISCLKLQNKFYDHFKDQIGEIQIIQEQDRRTASLDLDSWNSSSKRWNIEVPENIVESGLNPRKNFMDHLWSTLIEFDRPKKLEDFRSGHNKDSENISSSNISRDQMEIDYDHLDLHLIRELEYDFFSSRTALARKYGKDQSTISKRISNIQASLLDDVILKYDRAKLGLDAELLLVIDTKNELNVVENFNKILLSESFPFPYTWSDAPNQKMVHISVPYIYGIEIIEFAKMLFSKVQHFFLINRTYHMFNLQLERFQENGQWNVDDSSVISIPLSQLGVIYESFNDVN